ncbi:MAG: carboxymuconolactone decarboxylase family protein [Candidatus Tectimicrobiota bacterium]
MSQSHLDENPTFTQGLAIRREVLGEEHVNRSLQAAMDDPFLLPIQHMATEYGWGYVWSRPGLPRKTRSFLSLAFLAALGKHAEFRTHVRGAVRNGASRAEITEVLMQAALYCGVPVGLECFRLAKEVLDEMEASPSA